MEIPRKKESAAYVFTSKAPHDWPKKKAARRRPSSIDIDLAGKTRL